MESDAIPSCLAAYEATLAELQARFNGLANTVAKYCEIDVEKKEPLAGAVCELREAVSLYETDREPLLATLGAFDKTYADALPLDNNTQHAARAAFDPIAEAIRGLIKQVDLLYKLVARITDLGSELSVYGAVSATYDRRAVTKFLKQLEERRKTAVEQLKQAVYVHRQVVWLQDRFPTAELQAVPGLVKLVDRTEIEAADWSLTPGRYVGVAPSEDDENFDFDQVLRDLHAELTDLNREAVQLAATIEENFVAMV